ncbi:hypothetical protein E2C01_003595 [Portunus trituberculatus]|uniref:Uncharacterized protein n=1 Tax=Portunus trituberculatus TaxID=210409 RepID=A0A5B7CQ71_PORTR|nr:hypothetical protein [Portunus trituberculatus]
MMCGNRLTNKHDLQKNFKNLTIVQHHYSMMSYWVGMGRTIWPGMSCKGWVWEGPYGQACPAGGGCGKGDVAWDVIL